MDNEIILNLMRNVKRTREAVRYISTFEVSPLQRKQTLASWFREHTRAAPTPDQKREAYDRLLGQEINRSLRG